MTWDGHQGECSLLMGWVGGGVFLTATFELGLTASGRQRIDKAELDGIVKRDESATNCITLPN